MNAAIRNEIVDEVKAECQTKGIHVGILQRRQYLTYVSYAKEDALAVLVVVSDQKRVRSERQ